MLSQDATQEITAKAIRLGFSLVGICPAVEPTGASRLRSWLENGFAGEMKYLDREALYRDPSKVLDGVRSIVMLTMNYRTATPPPCPAGNGRVSRYAWGTDYHLVIRERLNELAAYIEGNFCDAKARGVVDSAPLMERDFAQLAGLGWIGKNTLLLNKQAGSWFFLAALLTSLELPYDVPFTAEHCGTCTACLDACPTKAFPQPYVLDARRCISYLTIEHRSAIPVELRSEIGDWLFGCDICQEVCPWNSKSPVSGEICFAPREEQTSADLVALFWMSDEQLRDRFRDTPLWRTKRRGLLRNAAVVLGNQKHIEAVPALIQGLCDKEPIVRGASAWALGRIGTSTAKDALQKRRAEEPEEEVAEEIDFALKETELAVPS